MNVEEILNQSFTIQDLLANTKLTLVIAYFIGLLTIGKVFAHLLARQKQKVNRDYPEYKLNSKGMTNGDVLLIFFFTITYPFWVPVFAVGLPMVLLVENKGAAIASAIGWVFKTMAGFFVPNKKELS